MRILSTCILYHNQDTSTRQVKASFQAHNAYVNFLESTDKGSTLITCSQDKTIKIWDLNTAQLKHSFNNSKSDHTGSVRALCMLSPNTLASVAQDKTIKIWDLTSCKQIKSLQGHTDTVSCVAKLSHGELVTSSFDKSIRIWDWQSGQCIKLDQKGVGHTDYIACLVTLPNDMIITGSWDKTIKRWRRV